ncbi:MAG: glycosyltransferase [bacterium]|nr:glycosyltransferase [bacterium]MDO8742402.1 glycosyltransferase [bacterium]
MKVCYINFSLNNPRDQITLTALRANAVSVTEISDNTPGLKKYLHIARLYREKGCDSDAVMVGYAGSVLVIFMRLMTRKKLFYNTLATFYDSMIISRMGGTLFSLQSLGYYLIDFAAFHLADRAFLECGAQKDMVVRMFRVKPSKISVHFVGTNDQEFYFDPTVPKLKQFTVVFRGMFLPEAGADVVIRAAKELEKENIRVRVIGRGLLLPEIERLAKELAPSNLDLIIERLPIEDLRRSMLECHLSLGQLADHPRVHTTVPHKVFESLSMKLPYLTGANKGVMEFLTDTETCFTVSPGDYRALAQKILELRDRSDVLGRVSESAYQLYQREFTHKILGKKILRELDSCLIASL